MLHDTSVMHISSKSRFSTHYKNVKDCGFYNYYEIIYGIGKQFNSQSGWFNTCHNFKISEKKIQIMVRYKKKIYKKRMSNKFRAQRHRRIQKLIKDKREEVEHQDFEDYSGENIRKGRTTRELLRSWAYCHGITARAINDLLKILILAGNLICCIQECLKKF